jgi:hypothetical protein
MEALVAVSLAGNVAQFAHITGKFISEAIAIKRTGDPKSLPYLRDLSNTLTTEAGVVRSRLKATNATLAEEEQVRALRRVLVKPVLNIPVVVPAQHRDRL